MSEAWIQFIQKVLVLLYYAEASNKFAGLISASLRPGNVQLPRRNVAAVASRWQQSVRFNQREIFNLRPSAPRQTRYSSTNKPVHHSYTQHKLKSKVKNSKRYSMFQPQSGLSGVLYLHRTKFYLFLCCFY